MGRARTTKSRPVLRVVPALTARTQLGQILRRVRQNKERFVVDRRGDPQAVIMSVEEYLRNFVEHVPLLDEIRQAAKAKGSNRMSMREINQEIKRYRRERRNERS